MNLKHRASINLPDIKVAEGTGTKSVFEQLMRLLYDTFKNIYDDLVGILAEITTLTTNLTTLTSTLPKTVSSATSLTLSTYGVYVFSGSSATTWTLPALSTTVGRFFYIKNRGSANITLQRAGSDNLYDTAVVTSITILSGESYSIINDGTYWLVM